MEGVVVAIAEENAEIEFACMLRDVRDEPRAGWPFGLEPVEFVRHRMRPVEDFLGEQPEGERIALVFHREAAHRHVVHALFARLQRIAPGDVVGGTRGPHLHLRVARQVLGNVPRVQFGAAVDGLAVALDDDRDLHGSGVAAGSACGCSGLDGSLGAATGAGGTAGSAAGALTAASAN